MSARRATCLLAALAAMALSLPAGASGPELGIEAPPPAAADLSGPWPDGAAVAGERLRTTLDGAEFPILPPLPAVSAIVADPVRTGSLRTAVEVPPAPVVIGGDDLLTGAIEVRLADPKLPLPARLAKRDRESIAAFYAARGHRPAWIRDLAWTPRGLAVADRLGRADEDGLDPADYPVPALGPAARVLSPTDLAEAELKLAAAAFLYARDARGGRLEPSRISALITPKLDLPAPGTVLARLTDAADAGATLAGFNPSYPGYRALRGKLADLRAGRSSLPTAQIRRRTVRTSQAIAVLGDTELPDASGPATMPNPRLEGDILANMERWRWLPPEVAARYVAVNVPEFRLQLIAGGRVEHEARVITGKAETPTPIFSGMMEYAIVNPSWYIPPSIMKNEILPGLARDPGYAARRGYEVVRRGGDISVRQPPGERNALGFIKFMFPNNHAVYLHDTPNRSLFGSGRRAFSHGCVRVENPFQLADFVLGSEWSESRLRRLVGRGERTIFLPEKLPVHLTYFTVAVDAFGGVQTFEDLYGYNRRTRQALGLGA